MKRTSNIFTPVERIDGNTETRNKAEKHMHMSRYVHAATILKGMKGSIIDIACGTGYGSLRLHTGTGMNVDGFDISREAIQYAKNHYSADGVMFNKASITDIPADDETYDAAVCYETIEHVRYMEAVEAIRELYRVLKPGGRLLISTPNRIYTFLLQLLGYKNPFHIYEFMPSELERLLALHRFRLVRRYGQSICFPVTYYMARNGWLPAGYFSPSRFLPPELSMIAIIEAVKI